MSDPLIDNVRDIALAFPGAVEVARFGQETFQVAGKAFLTHEAADDGSATLTMPTAPGVQDELLDHDGPYFEPDFLGAQGWIGMTIDDDTDWKTVGELAVEAYREVAPIELARTIGVRPGGRTLGAEAMLRVGSVIGELIEGKPPKEDAVAEAEADDDFDDGLKLDFDPDDPTATSIQI